jgi:AmmeMemoRadiSam system protein A
MNPDTEKQNAADAERGHRLLAIARAAIARKLDVSTRAPATDADWLRRPGATFVTLKRDGRLRGCIGSLQARRPLAEDVAANAEAAAFRDPRFAPLSRDELARTGIEVSLLSPPEALEAANEAEAIARLRPGIDGVIFDYGRHHGTFLPQVWEELGDPADFLHHLKYKAGLPPDFWHPDVRLSRYTVTRWREEDFR